MTEIKGLERGWLIHQEKKTEKSVTEIVWEVGRDDIFEDNVYRVFKAVKKLYFYSKSRNFGLL